MKRRTLLTTALASTAMASFFTFANVAQAGQNCGDKGGKGGYAKHAQMSDASKTGHMQKRLDRMSTKLGLSDDQKTQLQALKLNNRNDIKPLRDEQRALRKVIRELDPSASDYANKLADSANQQAELTRQMIVAKGNQRQQMATILTPEQLAKKKEMRASHKGGNHKRKGNRHHRKHGKQQQS